MHLRRKVTAAAVLLLICTVLLVSVSYAWLTLSAVPEISGVDTNIGANGNLEIALLNDETYADPSLIRTSVGDSAAVTDTMISNRTWGNVIDLSSSGYGLSEISMLPSRLNVRQNEEEEAASVASNMLIYPRYGRDGRSGDFYQDCVSAVYSIDEFTYSTQNQKYGVRAIGTASKMTVHQAALAGARSQIRAYTSAAVSTAASAWKTEGEDFLDIYIRRYYLDSDEFNIGDVAAIRDMAARIQDAVSYVDLALRQGVVAHLAAVTEDGDTFKSIRSVIENTYEPLYDILNMYGFRYDENIYLPEEYYEWAGTVAEDSEKLEEVIYFCDSIIQNNTGSIFSWEGIEWLLAYLMDASQVYWNDTALTQVSYVFSDNILTLTEAAGPMAHIAAFAGDYSTFIPYGEEASVEVTSLSAEETPRLVQISETLEDKQAACGDTTLTGAPIEDIYGYSIDLAFRCNSESDLLLQTSPKNRIEGIDNLDGAQGQGSYMTFESDSLSGEEIARMMDAVRIGFIDNRNKLIALAKCSSSYWDNDEKWASANIYLTEFSVADDGCITVGDPLGEDGTITELMPGVPTVVTVVIWLDGDYVANSMAASSGKSMSGRINLQFSGSADLKPADFDYKKADVN